jgi:ADP-heptose:LPS heptosyltransferase
VNHQKEFSIKTNGIRPENLRLDPDRLYTFKSPLKMAIARTVDTIGSWFFSPSGQSVDWKSIKKIAVLRLDHLGDVILALPAIKALEEALPQAQVDFIVGPWAKDIVEMAGLRSTPKVFSACWFAREGSKNRGRKLTELLREGQYDTVIELRGDFRHILAMYRAGIRFRVGLAKTGLGFLLTHRLVYRPGQHEMKRNLDTLEQAGIQLSNKQEYPQLYTRKKDEETQREIRQKLGITRPVIAIHATCAATSKRWPVSNWQQLIDRLPEDMDVAMIGTDLEKSGVEEIQKGCHRRVFLTAGALNLPNLSAFLKESRLFIGVDSGPAHIAAAVGTPVVSLYSGTNVVDQWGPRGPKVTIIQKTPSCSPCELTVCPIGNECMNQIGVEEVLGSVTKSLEL